MFQLSRQQTGAAMVAIDPLGHGGAGKGHLNLKKAGGVVGVVGEEMQSSRGAIVGRSLGISACDWEKILQILALFSYITLVAMTFAPMIPMFLAVVSVVTGLFEVTYVLHLSFELMMEWCLSAEVIIAQVYSTLDSYLGPCLYQRLIISGTFLAVSGVVDLGTWVQRTSGYNAVGGVHFVRMAILIGLLLFQLLMIASVTITQHDPGVHWIIGLIGVIVGTIALPMVVCRYYTRYGHFGAVVGVVLWGIFGMISVFAWPISVLFALTGLDLYFMQMIMKDTSDVEKNECVVIQSNRDLSHRMSLDLSKLDRWIPPDDMRNFVNSQLMPESVRSMALVGDRAMQMAVSLHIVDNNWTVKQASDFATSMLTNAHLTRYFDRYLQDVFPEMRLRSEKRKGSMVEALVGVAYKNSMSNDRIAQFVFDKLATICV